MRLVCNQVLRMETHHVVGKVYMEQRYPAFQPHSSVLIDHLMCSGTAIIRVIVRTCSCQAIGSLEEPNSSPPWTFCSWLLFRSRISFQSLLTMSIERRKAMFTIWTLHRLARVYNLCFLPSSCRCKTLMSGSEAFALVSRVSALKSKFSIQRASSSFIQTGPPILVSHVLRFSPTLDLSLLLKQLTIGSFLRCFEECLLRARLLQWRRWLSDCSLYECTLQYSQQFLILILFIAQNKGIR